MPQDILQIPVQDMQGEWTVEKWEFWFRNSQLSPAVQELAQYGIMTGQINAASVFHIPERYQPLLSQLQHHLEAALREQWPQTIFQVKFEDVEQLTPYTMQKNVKYALLNAQKSCCMLNRLYVTCWNSLMVSCTIFS